MHKLESYLDYYDNRELSVKKLTDFESFGYQDKPVFDHHLEFLLNNCYNIKLVDDAKVRLNQQEFRKQLINKFNGKCLITGENCEDELEACHIIPVADKESYDIDNGLLLRSNIHKTFDKYLWSINPETLVIEVKGNINVGSIIDYNGCKIKLKLNPDLKSNLEAHYKNFSN